MVDRVEVFKVADQLRALRGKEAVRVSVRRVREKLFRRGSFSDVGRELTAWKTARNYQPVIELMALPDALQKRLGDFGKALLDEVQASESRIRDCERANFEVERAAYREMLDEAGMTVDALEAQVAALTAEVEMLRKAGTAVTFEATPEQAADEGRPSGVPARGGLRAVMARTMDRRVPGGAQEAFWRDVEKEVLALLRAKGPMYPGDLLVGLPRTLVQRGSDVEMPLSVGWLRFRLRAMAEAGKPLAEKDGRFAPVEEAHGSPGVPAPEEAEVRAPPPSLGDSVMWEIRRLLLERGPMKPVEIRKHLPQRVHEAARKHWKGGLGRLAKDMSERAGRGYYFKRLDDGRYAALEAVQPEEPGVEGAA